MRFLLSHNYQKVVLDGGISILEANGTKGYIMAQKDHALNLAVAKKGFNIMKHSIFDNLVKSPFRTFFSAGDGTPSPAI